MDANLPTDGGKVNMRELTEYQIVDEEFIIEVRLKLPEAVPPRAVRVAFTANSLEVFALGKEVAHRSFILKLYKPVVVEPMLACGVDEEEENLRDSAQVR